MDFKLKHGPWKTLFRGQIEGHPLEIYTNPDLIILVALEETDVDKPIGIVLEAFKVFHAMGELEAFVSKFPKEAIAAIKHNPEQTIKFIIANSKPSYARYEQEKANKEVDELLLNLEDNAKMMQDVSSAYDLDLIELNEAPEEIRDSFFAEPLLLHFISPAMLTQSNQTGEQSKTMGFGKANIGLTKDGKIAKEPMVFLKKTIISEGRPEERRHAMHILLEDCLLSGTTAIVIDWQNLFTGLTTPTRRTGEFQKFGLELDPIGFPVKEFFAQEQVKIGISTLSPHGFIDIFGLGDNSASKKIIELMQNQKFSSINALSKKILEEQTEEGFNEYQKHLALRFLKLVETIYENLFGEQMSIEMLCEGGVKGISRANIIHVETIDDRAKLLILDSLINSLWNYFSKKGATKETNAMLFIPEAQKFFPQAKASHLAKQTIENMRKLEKYGVGFVFEAEKEIELLPSLRELAEARISLVKDNDAGIYLKDQKVYRVYLRPALSICTEFETKQTRTKKED